MPSIPAQKRRTRVLLFSYVTKGSLRLSKRFHCHRHPRRSLSRHRLAAAHLQIDGTLHVDVGGRWITYTPTHTPNDTPTHTPQVSLRGHQTAKHCWTSTRSALRTNTCDLHPDSLPNGAGIPTGRGHGFIIPQVSLRGHQTAKHCWTSTRSALRTFTGGLRPAYLPNGAGTPTGSNIA